MPVVGLRDSDATELYAFTVDLKTKVIAWIEANYKKYMRD
jgi:hypothetical protein